MLVFDCCLKPREVHSLIALPNAASPQILSDRVNFAKPIPRLSKLRNWLQQEKSPTPLADASIPTYNRLAASDSIHRSALPQCGSVQLVEWRSVNLDLDFSISPFLQSHTPTKSCHFPFQIPSISLAPRLSMLWRSKRCRKAEPNSLLEPCPYRSYLRGLRMISGFKL